MTAGIGGRFRVRAILIAEVVERVASTCSSHVLIRSYGLVFPSSLPLNLEAVDIKTMADAICGPSNPLQNFQKHTALDRTLQHDRLTAGRHQEEVSSPCQSLISPVLIDI